MKVWIVNCTSYYAFIEQKTIAGVFSTKEKAIEFIQTVHSKNPSTLSSEYTMEEDNGTEVK